MIAGLAMMGALSIDAYLPALPTIARNFSCSLAAVQQTLTVYLFAQAVMTLFYGTISDSFGRRPVILGFLIIYLASTVGAALAPTLGWLFFFRLVQGFSSGAGGVVGRALVADLLSGAAGQRIMSYIWAVFGIAPALAPILGGWMLSALGWRSIFYGIAFFTLVLLLVCLRYLPETLPREKRHAFRFGVIVGNYLEVGRHRTFMFRSLAMSSSFGGMMLYVASAPAYVINILHLSVREFGWFFLTLMSGMTLGSAAVGRLSHLVPPEKLIRIGYAVMAAVALENLAYSIFFTPRVPWAVVPFFFYGVAVAGVAPVITLLTLQLFPAVKGMASSLQSFLFTAIFTLLAGVVAPLLFSSAVKLALGLVTVVAWSMTCWWIGSRGVAPHEFVRNGGREAVGEELPAM